MFRVSKYVVPIFVIMTFILACNLSTSSKNPQVDKQITVTGEQTPLVVAVPTEQPPQPTVEPTATVEPTLEPTSTPIVHLDFPDAILPTDKPQVTYDQESIKSADEKEAYAGDQFPIGRYERPFDQEMLYIPFIDIKQSNLIRNKDNQFIYTDIFLLDNPSLVPDSEYGFGIELDVNVDGRGEYLVWTKLPLSTEWSVEGVRVLKDANKSVGSDQPMLCDPPTDGNGFELTIFDSGVGLDSDLAWSRISPQDPTIIEIAFKKTILEESQKFLWGTWSILGPDQFDRFDHNDYFTYVDAGSATRSDKDYYPLKVLYSLDNTCRAASGFTPKGNEPGLCPITPIVKNNTHCVHVCIAWNLTNHTCRTWADICH
jgi:hypothetical protein